MYDSGTKAEKNQQKQDGIDKDSVLEPARRIGIGKDRSERKSAEERAKTTARFHGILAEDGMTMEL